MIILNLEIVFIKAFESDYYQNYKQLICCQIHRESVINKFKFNFAFTFLLASCSHLAPEQFYRASSFFLRPWVEFVVLFFLNLDRWCPGRICA